MRGRMFELDVFEIIMLATSALIVGFSKVGIQGAIIPAVAMRALIFGGKNSSGIILPMVIVGDLIAIFKYSKKGNIADVLKLIPASIVGVVADAIVGNWINDAQFKFLIGIIVILCIILLIVREYQQEAIVLPDNPLIKGAVGTLSGFSSMVGNAAGPIFNVYILTQQLKKESMIGTVAWFFFLVNLIELPFHIFLWGTINSDTVKFTVFSIPFIVVGALVGIWFIKRINDVWYRRFIIIVTVLTALRLIL